MEKYPYKIEVVLNPSVPISLKLQSELEKRLITLFEKLALAISYITIKGIKKRSD